MFVGHAAGGNAHRHDIVLRHVEPLGDGAYRPRRSRDRRSRGAVGSGLRQGVDMRQRDDDRRLAAVRAVGEVIADAGDGDEIDARIGLVGRERPHDQVAVVGLGGNCLLLLVARPDARTVDRPWSRTGPPARPRRPGSRACRRGASTTARTSFESALTRLDLPESRRPAIRMRSGSARRRLTAVALRRGADVAGKLGLPKPAAGRRRDRSRRGRPRARRRAPAAGRAGRARWHRDAW